MKHDWEIIGINELEKLAIEWAAFDLQNKYSPAIIKLIAAYREAVDAIVHIQRCIPINGFAQIYHESPAWKQIEVACNTAKRLGVE